MTAQSPRPAGLRIAGPLVLLALALGSCGGPEREAGAAPSPAPSTPAATTPATPTATTLPTPPGAPEALPTASATLAAIPPAIPPATPDSGVTPPVPAPSPQARLEDEQNTIDVFSAAAPATVFVTQKRVVRDLNMRALEVPAGSGTGFLWDTEGHIVTNFHVVDTGRARGSYSVTLYNQKTYDAVLVGGEPNRDIAVLKIDAPTAELTAIRVLGADGKVEVGQKTVAIGNPFGLDHTLTTGVVSALGREVVGYGGLTIRDMIQTDASINPGNSGGPLLDSRGRLIGMNTMIFSKTGSSAGIGFAVPVTTIRRVVPQLIRSGKVERAGLGIQFLPDDVAARARVQGVIITGVLPGSPAARAGIVPLRQTKSGDLILGDILVGVDHHPIKSYDDLYNALERYKVDDEVQIRVLREGEVVALKMRLVALE